ncbi:MAG TPA: regulatory protein RecX [Bacteroidia bacterium]|nr:regulatory protein RecX [Bacteroidia bacterium]
MKTTKPWDEEDALEKLRKYCAWQERCRSEAWTKLLQLGSPRGDLLRLLAVLEQEGFLDEARFARSYARGKFNQKGWGRIKIREGLRSKRVAEDLIDEALELIEAEAYGERLLEIARKRLGAADLGEWETQQKLRGYLEGKGYEWDAIDQALKALAD